MLLHMIPRGKDRVAEIAESFLAFFLHRGITRLRCIFFIFFSLLQYGPTRCKIVGLCTLYIRHSTFYILHSIVYILHSIVYM